MVNIFRTLKSKSKVIDATFYPHGITFSGDKPALLNIGAKNVDLSGVNPNTLRLYYDNEETGQWEEIQTYDIIVKQDEGYVKVINAELWHFSRYAIGAE